MVVHQSSSSIISQRRKVTGDNAAETLKAVIAHTNMAVIFKDGLIRQTKLLNNCK